MLCHLLPLAGIPYHNYTLGRNLFDKKAFTDTLQNRQVAYLGETDIQQIGIIDSNYFYFYRIPSRKGEMVSVRNNLPVGNSPAEEKERKKLHEMSEAYYETSRYMLLIISMNSNNCISSG